MTNGGYGQLCGLARGAEVLGQRWTLLILRDLRVGPRRYSELIAGLPGIPSNTLSTRLKELEEEGVVTRTAVTTPERGLVYALTPRGEELGPVLDAISRWGAGGMRLPREGEIMTSASFVSALQLAAADGPAPKKSWDTVFTVTAGELVAQVVMRDGVTTVAPGAPEPADLTIHVTGPEFRDIVAGAIGAQEAIARGVVQLEGDPALFPRFTETLRVPYSPNAVL
jgi:DNA-binding HxlR family transcriptional regulator